MVEGNPGESLSGGSNAAPVIGEVLSLLLKDYKPPKKESEEEKPAEEEAAPRETEDAVDTERTEDLMNPEGAPTREELSAVE